MPKFKRRARKLSRIQIHVGLKSIPGAVLAPELVSEIIDGWLYNDELPDGAFIRMIEWDIEDGKRVGQRVSSIGQGVDQDMGIRQNLIQRFRSSGSISSRKKTSSKELGKGLYEFGDGFESDEDFDG